jgi:hypothetical protein
METMKEDTDRFGNLFADTLKAGLGGQENLGGAGSPSAEKLAEDPHAFREQWNKDQGKSVLRMQ